MNSNRIPNPELPRRSPLPDTRERMGRTAILLGILTLAQTLSGCSATHGQAHTGSAWSCGSCACRQC